MHYDFKQKLNKLDSNAYRGMKIPEIDRKLNEGLQLFIALVAEPRIRNQMGVEISQRNIDDLSPIIVNDELLTGFSIDAGISKTYLLPNDYAYYLSADIIAEKGTCTGRKMDVTVVRHNDNTENLEFNKSSFEWGEINIRFYKDGIKVFLSDFDITSFKLNYIKEHPYIHDAEDFSVSGYELPDGTELTEYQDCLLPARVHPEIVDLAVLLTTTDLNLPMSLKLKLNNLTIKQLT